MGAGCYPCYRGTGLVAQRPSGDALGSCRHCGSLSCHGHGDYDANGPAWECVHCVPALLTAAAGYASPSSVVAQLTASALLRAAGDAATLEAFVAERGLFADGFVERIDSFVPEVGGTFWTHDTEPVWYGVEGESRRFLAAAVRFALDHEIDEDLLPVVLVPLARQAREAGW